mmetsp:Transcript_7253/g.15109  ORF Transcript_7253/g.15109 Transcript_7253/m.15109 type:complete len:204 (-) Transcript_7253:45-656(-)
MKAARFCSARAARRCFRSSNVSPLACNLAMSRALFVISTSFPLFFRLLRRSSSPELRLSSSSLESLSLSRRRRFFRRFFFSFLFRSLRRFRLLRRRRSSSEEELSSSERLLSLPEEEASSSSELFCLSRRLRRSRSFRLRLLRRSSSSLSSSLRLRLLVSRLLRPDSRSFLASFKSASPSVGLIPSSSRDDGILCFAAWMALL